MSTRIELNEIKRASDGDYIAKPLPSRKFANHGYHANKEANKKEEKGDLILDMDDNSQTDEYELNLQQTPMVISASTSQANCATKDNLDRMKNSIKTRVNEITI